MLRAAALTDDEVRRTHEHHVRLQREGFGGVVRMLGEKGLLPDGLDEARATDVPRTVFGDSTYHLLRTEHGWSHEAVVAWFEHDVARPAPRHHWLRSGSVARLAA